VAESIWSRNGGISLGYPAQATRGDPPPLDKPLRYAGDRHIVTIGPNRTGKTKRLLAVALHDLTDWSIVVNDLRGDLCKMTEAHRRAAGNIIVKLNPFDVLGLGSAGLNPVATLELNKEFPDNALELAESIIRVEGREPHWSQAAQEITAAIIMYVRIVIENGSLVDVRALLGQDIINMRRLIRGGGNVDPRQYELFERDPEGVPKGYLAPFRYKDKLYPGLLAVADEKGWPQMRAKAARFGDINPENRELLGVLGTALTQTRWLDSIPVSEDLAKNPFDFSVMRERPVTVYLILPARRLGTHSSWLRLMVTSILQKLMVDARKANVPTLLAFDEYAAMAGSTGYGAEDSADGFPVVARNMPMMAGYSIKLWTFWQDMGQAVRIYGKEGFESFLGNAGVVQILAPRDVITAEFFSKLTGQTTRQFVTHNQSRQPNPAMPGGTSISFGANQNMVPMPLMLPQDLRNMADGYTLVFTHLEQGPVRSYLPWPGLLRFMRAIMALDPSN
jgi:type IV secretion system protein VirD4